MASTAELTPFVLLTAVNVCNLFSVLGWGGARGALPGGGEGWAGWVVIEEPVCTWAGFLGAQPPLPRVASQCGCSLHHGLCCSGGVGLGAARAAHCRWGEGLGGVIEEPVCTRACCLSAQPPFAGGTPMWVSL